jgi:predicted lipoprotein
MAVGATFDRRAMLTEIVNELILPLHEQLVVESIALEAAVTQLAEEPTVETLNAAQAQWRTTAEAWARVEPLQLRFAMLVSSQVKKWPINVEFIEEFIASEEKIDEASISASGSTAKGLAALEYLLFSQAENDEILIALTTDPQRMAYLLALAQNLISTSSGLLGMWAVDGDNQAQALIEADFNVDNVQGSISMLTNEMIALVEGIIKIKIDNPLQVWSTNEPQPESVESPFAKHSRPLIVANLQTMQAYFDNGLASYLIFLVGDDQLANTISAQFEKTIAAVSAIEPSLETAVVDNQAAVIAARTELRALLVLLKTDMANQMGLTITFSDNDGD